MARLRLIALLVSVVLVGACGSDGGKKESTATTATTAADGNIRSLLLAASDLPAGFTRSSLDVDKKDETSSTSGCEQLDRVDEQFVKSSEHDADVTFQRGDGQTAQFLDQNVVMFATAAKANEFFDAEVDGFKSCKNFDSVEDDGSRTTGTVSAYPFPTIGDDTYAVSLSVSTESEGEALSFAGPVVLVRKGAHAAMIFGFHVADEPGLTAAEFEAVVRKAADKL